MIRQRWTRFATHVRRRKPGNSHAASGHPEIARKAYPVTRTWRLLEAGFLLGDLLFIPEILLLLNRLFKPNTRKLGVQEIAIARTIFGENIDYQKIRIDERSLIGCRQFHFAYVGFNCINCWGSLSNTHFIHELVHVWQFQTLGSLYIPRALWAQRTAEGYNYGGVQALESAAEAGGDLSAFNFEQQGDIVADFYCLKTGLKPRWCEGNATYLPVFEKIVRF